MASLSFTFGIDYWPFAVIEAKITAVIIVKAFFLRELVRARFELPPVVIK